MVLWSATTGLLTGLAVTLFEHVTVDDLLPRVLGLPVGATALLPVSGLAVAAGLLRYVGRGTTPATSDAYLQAFHGHADLGWQASLARMGASVATIGTGGAMGLGPGFVAPALLAVVVGELVMGRSSVTEYQVAAYDSTT